MLNPEFWSLGVLRTEKETRCCDRGSRFAFRGLKSAIRNDPAGISRAGFEESETSRHTNLCYDDVFLTPTEGRL